MYNIYITYIIVSEVKTYQMLTKKEFETYSTVNHTADTVRIAAEWQTIVKSGCHKDTATPNGEIRCAVMVTNESKVQYEYAFPKDTAAPTSLGIMVPNESKVEYEHAAPKSTAAPTSPTGWGQDDDGKVDCPSPQLTHY